MRRRQLVLAIAACAVVATAIAAAPGRSDGRRETGAARAHYRASGPIVVARQPRAQSSQWFDDLGWDVPLDMGTLSRELIEASSNGNGKYARRLVADTSGHVSNIGWGGLDWGRVGVCAATGGFVTRHSPSLDRSHGQGSDPTDIQLQFYRRAGDSVPARTVPDPSRTLGGVGLFAYSGFVDHGCRRLIVATKTADVLMDGRTLKTIATLPPSSWFPYADGSRLLLAQPGVASMRVIDASTGRLLAQANLELVFWESSSADTFFATSPSLSAKGQIAVVDAASLRIRRVIGGFPAPGHAFAVASSDQRYVAFLSLSPSYQAGGCQILDSARGRLLTTSLCRPGNLIPPSWSPTGHRFALVTPQTTRPHAIKVTVADIDSRRAVSVDLSLDRLMRPSDKPFDLPVRAVWMDAHRLMLANDEGAVVVLLDVPPGLSPTTASAYGVRATRAAGLSLSTLSLVPLPGAVPSPTGVIAVRFNGAVIGVAKGRTTALYVVRSKTDVREIGSFSAVHSIEPDLSGSWVAVSGDKANGENDLVLLPLVGGRRVARLPWLTLPARWGPEAIRLKG